MDICKRRCGAFENGKNVFAGNNTPSAAANLTVTFSSQLNQHNQVIGAVLVLVWTHVCFRRRAANGYSLFIALSFLTWRFPVAVAGFVSKMASTGGPSLSLSGSVPLLNYQPALYQQATINIPGLTQQGVPLQTRPPHLCTHAEPFQQTLIVCPPTIQGEDRLSAETCEISRQHFHAVFLSTGIQTAGKSSAYPVRMDSSVPLVPQNQSSQSLHIQPGVLTQVGPDGPPLNIMKRFKTVR